MEELNVSPVNAEPVANVEPQGTPVIEPVNAGSGEVATPQAGVKQTPEQNAEFARVRREAEAKTRDQVVSEMYGESNGIHTYAEYQKAVADQQAEEQRVKLQQETGIDPNSLKPVFEQWKKNDPDFQELNSIRQEKNMTTSLNNLNSELKDAGIDLQLKDLSVEEIAKLPNVDKITEIVKRGHTLADAFFLANKKDIISKQSQAAEQAAIKKIVANGQSSPGSLGTGGETQDNSIYSMSKADFHKMQEEVLRGDRKKV